MPRGGARRGAGHPKGWDKERQRQRLRALFFQHQDDMVEAQIANARGIKYLVVRNKAGKFIRRVDENVDPERVAEGEEIVEVWLKDPSTQAFTDLANRALDKPTEQVNIDARGDITVRWEID